MTQENRNGLDHLMKAFDCAENAQKAFAAAGNIEGARIAKEASNKVYLSLEAAMRTCKRSGQAQAFGSGGGVEQYGTGGLMSEADYYESGGNIVEVDDKYMDMDVDDMDMDDEFVEVEEDEMFRDGGQIELPL